MDLSDVDLVNYQTERGMYQASKLGFVDPEPELKHSPFVHRQSQSGWSKFKNFVLLVVMHLVDDHRKG
jgi:hypothetical protein